MTSTKVPFWLMSIGMLFLLLWFIWQAPCHRQAFVGGSLLGPLSSQTTAQSDNIAEPSGLKGSRSPVEADPGVKSGGQGLASLQVEILWSDTNSAAEGIQGLLIKNGTTAGDVRSSAASGTILWESLELGDYIIVLDRGETRRVPLLSATHHKEVFVLDVGIDVRGAVMNSDGFPVEGADVLLFTGSTDRQPFIVAKSNTEGVFAIQGLTVGRYVGAEKSCFAASKLTPVVPEQALNGTVDVVIRLDECGGRIEGRVVARDGAPVSGADIVIGAVHQPIHVDRTPGVIRTSAVVAPGRHARSDANGYFVVDSIACEGVPLEVWASGFAPSLTNIPVTECKVSEATIQLIAGSSITGTIRDHLGNVVWNARVIYKPENFWGSIAADSSREGVYRLDYCPPGAGILEVTAETKGALSIDIALEEGIVLEQDITIPSHGTISGHVTNLGETGGEWRVVAKPITGEVQGPRRASVESDGSFVIYGCHPGLYTILVFGDAEEFPVAEKGGVACGDEGVVLIADLNRNRGRLRGTIIAKQAPLNHYVIVDGKNNHGIGVYADPLTGMFEFNNLAPDYYTLVITAANSERVFLGPYTVERESDVNIGVIELGDKCNLEVEFSCLSGPGCEQTRMWLSDEKGAFVGELESKDGIGAIRGVLQGSYRLNVVCDGYGEEVRSIVLAEKYCREEVQLNAGVRAEVVLDATNCSSWDLLECVLERDDGMKVVKRIAFRSGSDANNMMMTFWVKDGSYKIIAEIDNRCVAEDVFSVDVKNGALLLPLVLK